MVARAAWSGMEWNGAAVGCCMWNMELEGKSSLRSWNDPSFDAMLGVDVKEREQICCIYLTTFFLILFFFPIFLSCKQYIWTR